MAKVIEINKKANKPYDSNNHKLVMLEMNGLGAVVDVIVMASNNKNREQREAAERILLDTSGMEKDVVVGTAGLDALSGLAFETPQESIKSLSLFALASLAPTHSDSIISRIGWSRLSPYLSASHPVSVVHPASSLVANLTISKSNQLSVVESSVLHQMISLLDLKNSAIDKSILYTFANASLNSETTNTLVSHSILGQILKRLEADDENESLLLPFAQALHRIAIQPQNRASLGIAQPLLIGLAMHVNEDIHQSALSTLALLDALGSDSILQNDISSTSTSTSPPPPPSDSTAADDTSTSPPPSEPTPAPLPANPTAAPVQKPAPSARPQPLARSPSVNSTNINNTTTQQPTTKPQSQTQQPISRLPSTSSLSSVTAFQKPPTAKPPQAAAKQPPAPALSSSTSSLTAPPKPASPLVNKHSHVSAFKAPGSPALGKPPAPPANASPPTTTKSHSTSSLTSSSKPAPPSRVGVNSSSSSSLSPPLSSTNTLSAPSTRAPSPAPPVPPRSAFSTATAASTSSTSSAAAPPSSAVPVPHRATSPSQLHSSDESTQLPDKKPPGKIQISTAFTQPPPLELSPISSANRNPVKSPSPTSPPTSPPPSAAKPPHFKPPFQRQPSVSSTSPPLSPTASSTPATAFRPLSPAAASVSTSSLQSSKSSPIFNKQLSAGKMPKEATSPRAPQATSQESSTTGDQNQNQNQNQSQNQNQNLNHSDELKLSRANSSPGMRPKRKESGKKDKHYVVSPDDIYHIRSLDPNATDQVVTSRLPRMPKLTPKESLKSASVLSLNRKISDMSIMSPSSHLSKQEQRELRHQQQQLLMQHHQEQLMEQQKKQREIEEEKLMKHVETWASLRERLAESDDLSVQLKAMEELLELAKSDDVVPAVLGGVLLGLNTAYRTVQLRQFKADALTIIHLIAPRSPLSEPIVQSGIVPALIESLSSMDEGDPFFDATIDAITLLSTHHEKVQSQIQSINALDMFSNIFPLGGDEYKGSIAKALAAVAAKNPLLQECIVKNGFIQPMVQLLDSPLPEVQRNVASALYSFADGYPQAQQEIIKFGALEPLLKLLTSPVEASQGVGAAAIKALAVGNVKIQDTVREQNYFPTFVDLLEKSSTAQVLIPVSSAILELIKDNEKNQETFGSSPYVIAHLVARLTFPDTKVAQNVLRIILVLSKRKKRQKQFIEANISLQLSRIKSNTVLYKDEVQKLYINLK